MEMISIPRKSINKERKEEDNSNSAKNKKYQGKIFTVIDPYLFHIPRRQQEVNECTYKNDRIEQKGKPVEPDHTFRIDLKEHRSRHFKNIPYYHNY